MNELIWLTIALIFLLFIFILIIFTKLTISINYYHHNDNDDLKIEFKVWFGLIKYKINIPLIKIDDNSPSVIVKRKKPKEQPADETKDKNVNQITPGDVINTLKTVKELLHQVFNLHVVIRKFFSKVTIKQFEWHSMIGIGDAAFTGTLTGALWAIKGSIAGMLSQYLKMKEMPNLTITPHFQLAVLQTRFTCIFQFRIGQAILAGLKLIKFWRGGRPHFKSKTNSSKEKTKSV
ncbi:DUF2953 domain-containing protein [Neobacillus ginsengisoli]|uniref:DUF2953 domain-containing protein n=1 Tax=Neobacillus ginsengisoli TaxID=904295 RepID=A0ABT9XN98_9BACI|nr:DUF2953 domain-containing protein [Neobacillus ginsengisoli]MDQ0196991.1 hypothetical protein [Neobacillus ginsengisoli]